MTRILKSSQFENHSFGKLANLKAITLCNFDQACIRTDIFTINIEMIILLLKLINNFRFY